MAPHSVPGKVSCKAFGEAAVSDGAVNYNFLERIGQGRRSTVFLANCNRGRLRHRQIAIKKISKAKLSSVEVAQVASASAIHQSLHHPNILSLFSSFSMGAAHYQVLELCSDGSLSRFLLTRGSSTTLSESEMRGVLKSLVDALVYLRKEGVIHRDVKPANVLLTQDCRVKLSGFDLAIRISSTPAVSESKELFSLLEITPYTSPEMLSCLPYSFPTDLWSLGCLFLECISGETPYKEIAASKASQNVTEAAYMLPENLLFETKDLISSLLQIDPNHRIPLHRITSHPFFNPAFPIVALISRAQGSSTTRNLKFDSPSPASVRAVEQSSPPPKATSTRNRARYSDAPITINKRKTFGEIGNRDPRRLLSDEMSSNGRDIAGGSGRRVVSDPTPRKRGAPFANRVVSTTTTVKDTFPRLPDQILDRIPPRDQIFPSVGSRPIYPDTLGKKETTPPVRESVSAAQSRLNFPVSQFPRGADEPFSEGAQSVFVEQISIGTCRPSSFTTFSLMPQTQKATHGHITILPSRALLIDFREGERRKTRKGDEVLVVSPCGTEVQVFSAPHLSIPCCLAEPSAVYPIDELPTMYWKQYNDAGHLIERLKQRTAKLILYQDQAKCTLMSNSPYGDIELLFPGSSSRTSRKRIEMTNTGPDERSQSVNPTMRIRLSRKTMTLEIAQYVTSRRGGEWTKKVLPSTVGRQANFKCAAQIMDQVDLDGLLPLERTGIECLAGFLRVCEAVEILKDFERTSADCDSLLNAPDVLLEGGDISLSDQLVTRRIENASKTSGSSQLSTGTGARRGPLALLNIAPRPRRVSGFSVEQKLDDHPRKIREGQETSTDAFFITRLSKPKGRKMP